jgi:hypothetical protein
MEVSGELQSRPLYLRETVFGIHWIGDGAGPRVDLAAVERRQILTPS